MAIKIIMLGFLAMTAWSMPTVDVLAEPHCDGWYLVEKWGHVFSQASYNSTDFGEFRGCKPESWKRDDPYDTRVEPSDDHWEDLGGVNAGGKTIPYPHEELLNRYMELCWGSMCDGDKSIEYEGLTLNIDAKTHTPELRDHFFELIREALSRAQTKTQFNELYPELFFTRGPTILHASSGFGEASGFYMTVKLIETPKDTPGCPAIVNTINSYGSLVPHLAPVFGLAGAICESLE